MEPILATPILMVLLNWESTSVGRTYPMQASPEHYFQEHDSIAQYLRMQTLLMPI